MTNIKLWRCVLISSFILVLLATFDLFVGAEANGDAEIQVDFYDMLNVSRSATKKDIRKAFKKIALEKHPDKNKENPGAHDVFVRINRAYSVLIDDTRRDIYDRLGHNGLEEHEKSGEQQQHSPGGSSYESWTFYQQSFGLYDDDPWVVTLSQADFERNLARATVGPFEPVWFVDFYSAHCSHCHHLAPHWKRVAEVLRGVINVGAVNCLEEWGLCATQRLAAYPTLKLFPYDLSYPSPADNKWDADELTAFALSRVPRHYVLLHHSPAKVEKDHDQDRSLLSHLIEYLQRESRGESYYTFDALQTSLASRRPWLVVFCHDDLPQDDVVCPSDISLRRLSRHFFRVVDVLLYRCRAGDHGLCLTHGLKMIYYPRGLSYVSGKDGIDSEEVAKPIDVFSTLTTLPTQPTEFSQPDTVTLGADTMLAVSEALWHQIPDFPLAGLPEMERLFAGYAFETANFAAGPVESGAPHLVVLLLDPALSEQLSHGSEPSLDEGTVRQLSQIKRLSSPLSSLGLQGISYFNCYFNAQHTRYCADTLGISKAPSTKHDHAHNGDNGAGAKVAFVLFKDGRLEGSHLNSTAYEIYHGPVWDVRNEQVTLLLPDIVDFVRQSLSSRTLSLKPVDLVVLQRSLATQSNSLESKGVAYWVIDFFAPWCPPCMRLLPELRRATAFFNGDDISNAGHDPQSTTLNFGTVDCVEHKTFCTDVAKIKSFPSLHWYSVKADSPYPLTPVITADGFQNVEGIVDFVMEGLKPSPVQVLTPESFALDNLDGPLSGKTVWFVDFGARWCGPCNQLEPVWKKFSKTVTDWAKVGTMDCGEYKEFCRSIGVRTFPRMRAYVAADKISDYPDHWWRDLNSIKTWALQFLPSKVEIMDAKAIQSRVLHSRKPWIIDYYANWCGHCTLFAPEFDKLHQKLGGILSFGKIDCAGQRQFCQDQKIPHYPTVRLYLGMGMYEELDSLTADALEPEIRGILANLKEEDNEVRDEL